MAKTSTVTHISLFFTAVLYIEKPSYIRLSIVESLKIYLCLEL